MNERLDSLVFEEFQLVPYTNEANFGPRQTNFRGLYFPILEMKTQSHSSTGFFIILVAPHFRFIRQAFEFQVKINFNDFVCGFNEGVSCP